MGAATYARLDTLTEFPGAGELSLTRAIVQYREAQAVDGAGEGIDDIGVALVVDGDYAAAAEALDLGSGRIRHLDLATEVVILDWVYASTLDYVRILLRTPGTLFATPAADPASPLRRYGQDIALGVLARIGFGALTRPTFLRIGFRDILRDLDPNEHPAVRVAAGPDDRIEVRMDCDNNGLLVWRRRPAGDAELKRLLLALFPTADVRRLAPEAHARFQLRFPLPYTFQDARDLLRDLRDGILGLFANFEPERHRATRHALDVFGPRDTLSRLGRRPVEPPARVFAPAAGVA